MSIISVFSHRNDPLSMMVREKLVELGVPVKLVDISLPPGEGLAVYSSLSPDNSWVKEFTIKSSICVSSEEEVPRVVQEVLRRLQWREMSLAERGDKIRDDRNEAKRRRRQEKRPSHAMEVSS